MKPLTQREIESIGGAICIVLIVTLTISALVLGFLLLCDNSFINQLNP